MCVLRQQKIIFCGLLFGGYYFQPLKTSLLHIFTKHSAKPNHLQKEMKHCITTSKSTKFWIECNKRN